MLDAGVTSLRLSIVQVWRPLCLANLSSHFIRMVNEEGEHAAVEFDANWIEKGVYAHRAFREAGVNVLLLSYADLLWRPDVVLQRLRSFLPGELLHGVHFDFEPKLGRDQGRNQRLPRRRVDAAGWSRRRRGWSRRRRGGVA